MSNLEIAWVDRLWSELGGERAALSSLELSGEGGHLPSLYRVGPFAGICVALASLAAAELLALRNDEPLRGARVERAHAAVAFRSERYLSAVGWQLPPVWDPIAGDYETADGFIRLHTNYARHRRAVLAALGVAEERTAVARAVKSWAAFELESAVSELGGAAAALRSAREFEAHPQGRALAAEPLFALSPHACAAAELGRAERPLAGVRVLDLTRVIAGPVCTRFLAAYGADVLRIDPPGFDEVPLLLSEVTAGKRRTALDLRSPGDRSLFTELVAGADVLVHGLRSDALERLGFGEAWRRRTNPALISASLDAYGFSGPWAARRGFDSLVQMCTGIAAAGMEALGKSRPVPLPAQALDHGTGYLLAAATCRALSERVRSQTTRDVRMSLARTARLLVELGADGDPRAPDVADPEPYLEDAPTHWGAVRRVRCPGSIEGIVARWDLPAGPLGIDSPRW